MVTGLAFAAADRLRCSPRRPSCATPAPHAHQAGLDDLAGPVRPGLGRPRPGIVDRLGQRDVPGLLPARRGAERAVARPRHRLPPRWGRPRCAERVGRRGLLHRPRHRGDPRRADRRPDPRHGIPVGKDVFDAFPARWPRRQRGRRRRDHRRRAVVGGALRPRPRASPGSGRAARRQRADRARHPRAVERRADPGDRRQRRGVRVSLARDHGDLRRLPRRRAAIAPRVSSTPADGWRSQLAAQQLPDGARGSSSTTVDRRRGTCTARASAATRAASTSTDRA